MLISLSRVCGLLQTARTNRRGIPSDVYCMSAAHSILWLMHTKRRQCEACMILSALRSRVTSHHTATELRLSVQRHWWLFRTLVLHNSKVYASCRLPSQSYRQMTPARILGLRETRTWMIPIYYLPHQADMVVHHCQHINARHALCHVYYWSGIEIISELSASLDAFAALHRRFA